MKDQNNFYPIEGVVYAKPVIVVERSYIGKDWVASYPPTTTGDNSPQEYWNIVFQGTLPECEAWISLREKNYI